MGDDRSDASPLIVGLGAKRPNPTVFATGYGTHDLAWFVRHGLATVSEDGAYVTFALTVEGHVSICGEP
jgi:hypothetical protein